ncbi:PIN domain-containing protein [Sphingomonas glacialis]|uniref:PIN domain-containing protein n=1 Tax=Sphingomonas glacialis TaxID=658225 RepID=UPI0019D5181A|nr:PIN domain-containing protein [Sphingomonas glacialis]
MLNEVATVVLRKLAFSFPEVLDVLDRLRAVATVVPLTIETPELALQLHARYRFAIYDCLIVAAALLADCDTLWSEDMHHGLVIEGRLTIRNPFAA